MQILCLQPFQNREIMNQLMLFHLKSNTWKSSVEWFISFPKGTYFTLVEVQADLAGTVIYYQLTTPGQIILDFMTATTEQMDTYYNHYVA